MNYTVSDEDKDEILVEEQVGTGKESVMDQEDGGIDKHIGNQGGETGMEDRLLVEETGNKMDTSMVDDDQVDDPSDQCQASKEYLQFGGGFCFKEDEEDKEFNEQDMVFSEKCDVLTSEENRDKSPLVKELNMHDPAEQGPESKEYLQFGGGFCLNEEEEDKEFKEGDVILEKCDVASEENHENSPIVNELNTHNQSSSDFSSLGDDPDAKFLLAMPNLRRKRKRN